MKKHVQNLWFDANDNWWGIGFVALMILISFIEACFGIVAEMTYQLLLLGSAAIASFLLQFTGFCKLEETRHKFVLGTFVSFLLGGIIGGLIVKAVAFIGLDFTLIGLEWRVKISPETLTESTTTPKSFIETVVVICIYYSFYGTGMMSRILRLMFASNIRFPEPILDVVGQLNLTEFHTPADILLVTVGKTSSTKQEIETAIADVEKHFEDDWKGFFKLIRLLCKPSVRQKWSTCTDWSAALTLKDISKLPAGLRDEMMERRDVLAGRGEADEIELLGDALETDETPIEDDARLSTALNAMRRATARRRSQRIALRKRSPLGT